MKNILSAFVLQFFILSGAFGQVITLVPENPKTDSDITLRYDAGEGNGELVGYNGDVYAYTGVITDESDNNTDWKHVQTDWGTADPRTLMTRVSEDIYEISFNIRDFYQIAEQESVLKLAFLFHNEDYSLVGRTAEGSDIFVDINTAPPGAYTAYNLSSEQLTVETENGSLEIQFFTPSAVKAEYIHSGSGLPDTGFTVIKEPETVNPQLSETDEALSFSSSQLEVYITKNPLRLHFIGGNDTILQDAEGFTKFAAGGSVSFQTEENTAFYGGGSRAIPADRSGRKLKIYNEAHYGYGNNTPTLNISIPFVVSDKSYGLFFDNRFPADLDLGATNPQQLHYDTQGGRLRYYFMAGENYEDVLREYTNLTGRQKLPPLWALGYIQSKYGYENETHARTIVNQILDEDFPLDALILDLYWFGTTNDMGNLDWDSDLWPSPTEMMNDFSEKNIQTLLITEPYFTLASDNYNYLAQNNLLVQNESEEPCVLYGFWAGDAALLDITKKQARDWMWQFYKARHEEGVAGWWCDLGEPEIHPSDMIHEFGSAASVHNIYSLIWAKMLDKKYAENYPDERLFNLIRSGYAGLQHYSAFPWSGDIQRTYDGLRAQIPLMLGAGMSGLGYMHSDVGGFTGNEGDSELFTRWVQFGVFAPVLRLHGIGTVEPINHPEPYKSIMRNYIKLRYRMLPYNYTLAYENSTTGIPLARQLDYYDSQNFSSGRINDSYYWGKNFFVAPVLEPFVSERTLWLPKGKWLNYHDLTEYEGENSYTLDVDMENIPVFVRAGSFIPLAENLQSTADYSSGSILLQYFPDTDVPESYAYLYADNGHSPGNIAEEAYELLHFNGTCTEEEIRIDFSKTGSYTEAPDVRNFVCEIFRLQSKPELVKEDGAQIPEVNDRDEFAYESPAFYWDAENKKLFINIDWNSDHKNLAITKLNLTSVPTVGQKNREFYLHNIQPNPFINKCEIKIDVLSTGSYSFKLQNISGQTVMRFKKKFSQRGRHRFYRNFSNLNPGLYFLAVENGSKRQVRKIIKL